MLSIKNLTKTYKGGKKAVSNLNIEVAAGDIYGFIGHNGAGKTTTIKAVVGIIDFEEGDIYINGILFVSIPETIAIGTKIKDLCLKASFKVANRHLDGHIFSLRMYNRALSTREILQNLDTDTERYGIGG